MPFEWSETKRRRNILKHGIDFVDAKELWARHHIEYRSPQNHHDEERHIAVGELDDQIITIVFTWRGHARRLISARSARRYEKENYQNEIGRRS